MRLILSSECNAFEFAVIILLTNQCYNQCYGPQGFQSNIIIFSSEFSVENERKIYRLYRHTYITVIYALNYNLLNQWIRIHLLTLTRKIGLSRLFKWISFKQSSCLYGIRLTELLQTETYLQLFTRYRICTLFCLCSGGLS